MITEVMPVGQNAVAAFLVGMSWGTIAAVYHHIWGGRAGSGSLSLLTILDILFHGGGTGIFIYVTDTILSSFVYGLAGLVLVVAAVTGTRRLAG